MKVDILMPLLTVFTSGLFSLIVLLVSKKISTSENIAKTKQKI